MKSTFNFVILLLVCSFSYSQNLVENTTLVPADIGSNELFGAYEVEILEDYAVVGATFKDDVGTDNGAAYVYNFNGTTWVQVAKLTASDRASGDRFGNSISMHDDVIVISASLEDVAGSDRGSIYVFEMPPGGWVDMTETAKLTASDGVNFDYLGSGVAIYGDVIAATSPGDDNVGNNRGTIYVWEKAGSNWVNATEDAKLTYSATQDNDELGNRIKIFENTIAVSAILIDNGGTDRGAVLIWERPSGGWVNATEDAILSQAAGTNNIFFGFSMDMSENTIVVGAYNENVISGGAGLVYVYEKSNTNWTSMTESARLSSSDGAVGDQFGYWVKVFEDTKIAVGANNKTVGGTGGAGKVYYFERNGDNWANATEDASITASDRELNDFFGSMIDVDDRFIFSAAINEDGTGTDFGKVYVYDVFDLPDINSISATSNDETSLNFNVDIDDNNLQTSINLIYGLSSNNLSNTITFSNSPLSAYSGETSLIVNLSGLTKDTRYYYRISAQNSEGITNSDIGSISTLLLSDEDNVSNEMEDAAPNNGDGNGDGTLDSRQSDVSSISVSQTGKYVTMEIISGCAELDDVSEAIPETDGNYIFPLGAVEFTLPCSTAEVKLYFHGTGDLTGYNYRKLRANNTWFNFPNATFGSEIINGESVATVTLSLQDGGPEDYDGIANGIIYDPGGPAILSPDASIPIWDWWHLAILGGALFLVIKRFS